MACFSCARMFHDECIDMHEGTCCCSSTNSITPTPIASAPTYQGKSVTGTWQKDEANLVDPKSTGRKRAAILFPLDKEAMCEWSSLKFAGGGFVPIIGCIGNKQTHRHHGPDKDTINNNSGNVHRICVHCHNRWHASNDPHYNDILTPEGIKPHDPTTMAEVSEVLDNEMKWSQRKIPLGKLANNPHD